MLGTVEFREGKKVEVSWRHTAIDPLHNTSGDGRSCFRVFDRSLPQGIKVVPCSRAVKKGKSQTGAVLVMLVEWKVSVMKYVGNGSISAS